MQNCPECQESIDFVCTTCQTFFCKSCTSQHKEEYCYLDKPKTYFSRLLAVKEENIGEHVQKCNNMDEQLLILKQVLNKQGLKTSVQEIIKEDIENMESYCRKVDEAETKLEWYEEELKKEVPIVEMFKNIRQLEDSFDVPKLHDDTMKILLVQNAYVEPDKKNDKGEGLKQAERELQICLENQINDWINRIQELATKYPDNAKRSKQDMNNLEVNYELIKEKYNNEEAELKKESEKLIQENEKLLEDNKKLKKEKEEYEDEIKSKERVKVEITKEIENQQSKLNNIAAEIEEKFKTKKELEKKNSKQALDLKTITEKLAIKEEELNRLDKELNEIIGKVEAQTHNLNQVNKQSSEKEKVYDGLVKEDNAKKEILELEEKKKDLVQQYNIIKTDIEDLSKVKENYGKENIKLQEKNLELGKQGHRLESELKNWKQECDKKSEEHVKINNEIEASYKQKSELESKVKNLNEEFMKLNKKALQSYKQQMKEKVNEQKSKLEELLLQYKELDGKYKLQNSELDHLKSKLSSIEQSNKNLVVNIEVVKEEYKKEKQVPSNLIKDLKDEIPKHNHALYHRIDEITKDKKKYMRELKDSVKTRMNELAKYIKEASEKIGFQVKEASKRSVELRELHKNAKSPSQVKIDSDKSDIDQIYTNIKKAKKGIRDAYLKIKTEKEIEIKRLEEEISKSNSLIEAYEITIKKMANLIRDRENELAQHVNLVNQKNIPLEEMKKENTRVTKAEDEPKKQLGDSKNNESDLVQRYNKSQQDCNTLQQEKSKLMENVKTLQKDLKNLQDENKRIRRELGDSHTKIRSLEDTNTTLEKDNKLPVAEHKGKVIHEENKDICNIQAIYSHEIFLTGTLKNVTKENVYETKSIKLLSEICCFCLTGKAEMEAVCVYHLRCHKCFNKTKRDCKLCKVFGFKPLDFACDNCKSIVSLSDVNILICMYKNCNYCMKTGTSNTSKVTRYELPVRVL